MRVYEMDICENLEVAPYNIDRNDMFEYLWPRCEDPDGNIVGLEMALCPAGLGYRKDIAQDVFGVSEQKDMEKLFKDKGDNYDAYVTIGKEILEKTGGKTKMFAGLGDVWSIVYAQNPADLVNEDGSLNISGKIQPGLETAKKFLDAGIVSTIDQWTPQWEASYALGEVFCYPFATWTTEPVQNDRDPDGAGHWALMVPPYGCFSWGGTTMSVYKEGKNKESAWEFVRWTNWDLDGARKAAEYRDYQLSRISNYDADPSLATKYSDYYQQDLFKFWAEDAVDSAISVTPTRYDQVVGDSVSMALTALQADNSLTVEQLLETIKTEIKNKEPDIEFK